MANYVLLHGGWAGGWMWQDVANRLRAAGHQVYTPTFTGLGERIHLANPDIDLDTHIVDAANVLEYEDLNDVILVGYSYSGAIASGVAELSAGRISQLVYLDALILEDGQSIADLLGAEIMGFLEESAKDQGGGWQIPLGEPDDPRNTPQPLKPMCQRLTLSNPVAADLPRTFIYCKRGREDVGELHHPVSTAAERLKNDSGWAYFELDSGHMPMWSHPEELTELLLKLS